MPCEPNQPSRTPCQSCPSPNDFVRIPQGFGLTRIVREALQTNMELTQCLADFCGVNTGSDEDGGPYQVVDNDDGTLTVTDGTSNQSFTLDLKTVLEHLDLTQLSQQQCEEIANCITENPTTAQINSFTEVIDFTQLITNLTTDNQAALCQAIVDAGCDLTTLIDLQELIDNSSTAEFENLFNALCATEPTLFEVYGGGSTGLIADAVSGPVPLRCGGQFLIYSSDESVVVNVTEGSVLYDLRVNQDAIECQSPGGPITGLTGTLPSGVTYTITENGVQDTEFNGSGGFYSNGASNPLSSNVVIDFSAPVNFEITPSAGGFGASPTSTVWHNADGFEPSFLETTGDPIVYVPGNVTIPNTNNGTRFEATATNGLSHNANYGTISAPNTTQVTIGIVAHDHFTFNIASVNTSVCNAIGNLNTQLSGLAHTAITNIDLKPTANDNEFAVEVTWTDQEGNTQVTSDPTPVVIRDEICPICLPLSLQETGVYSNPTVNEFSFTPSVSGTYTFELSATGITPADGNAWIRIGTTSGVLPNGSGDKFDGLSDRVNNTTPTKTYDVELECGIPCYVSLGAGGNDTIQNATVRTISCPEGSVELPVMSNECNIPVQKFVLNNVGMLGQADFGTGTQLPSINGGINSDPGEEALQDYIDNNIDYSAPEGTQASLTPPDASIAAVTDSGWVEFYAHVPAGQTVDMSWSFGGEGYCRIEVDECGSNGYSVVDRAYSTPDSTVEYTLPEGFHRVRVTSIDVGGNASIWSYNGDAFDFYPVSSGVSAEYVDLLASCDGSLVNVDGTPFEGELLNPSTWVCGSGVKVKASDIIGLGIDGDKLSNIGCYTDGTNEFNVFTYCDGTQKAFNKLTGAEVDISEGIPGNENIGSEFTVTQPNDDAGAGTTGYPVVAGVVEFARGGNSGIFNLISETSFGGDSPADTLWRNDTETEFTDFTNAYGQQIGNNILDPAYGNGVMQVVSTGQLFEVTPVSWQMGGGGGFSFTFQEVQLGWQVCPQEEDGFQVTKDRCEVDTLAARQLQNITWELSENAFLVTTGSPTVTLPDSGESGRNSVSVIPNETYNVTGTVSQITAQNINTSQITVNIYDSDGVSLLGTQVHSPQNSLNINYFIGSLIPAGDELFVEYVNTSPTTATLQAFSTVVEGPQVVGFLQEVCQVASDGTETRLALYQNGQPYTGPFSVRNCPNNCIETLQCINDNSEDVFNAIEQFIPDPTCCVLDWDNIVQNVGRANEVTIPQGEPGAISFEQNVVLHAPGSAIGSTTSAEGTVLGPCGRTYPIRITATRLTDNDEGTLTVVTNGGITVNDRGTYRLTYEVLPDADGNTAPVSWKARLSSFGTEAFLLQDPEDTEADYFSGGATSYPFSWSGANNANRTLGWFEQQSVTFRLNGANNVGASTQWFISEGPGVENVPVCDVIDDLQSQIDSKEFPKFTTKTCYDDGAVRSLDSNDFTISGNVVVGGGNLVFNSGNTTPNGVAEIELDGHGPITISYDLDRGANPGTNIGGLRVEVLDNGQVVFTEDYINATATEQAVVDIQSSCFTFRVTDISQGPMINYDVFVGNIVATGGVPFVEFSDGTTTELDGTTPHTVIGSRTCPTLAFKGGKVEGSNIIPNVTTGPNFTSMEIGTHRDLTFEVPSTLDGDEVITFPIPFSTAPNEWDIQISIRNDGGLGNSAPAIVSGTLTATQVTVNRDDGTDNAESPFVIIRVRGLI